MDGLWIARRVEQNAARRILRSDPPEALAQSFMEGRVEALEPVASGSPGGGPRQADLDRQVEDQGQIRSKGAERKEVQCSEIGESQSPAIALIS